jgi:hypothetical protein
MGGESSCTDLVTCLEMARDAATVLGAGRRPPACDETATFGID